MDIPSLVRVFTPGLFVANRLIARLCNAHQPRFAPIRNDCDQISCEHERNHEIKATWLCRTFFPRRTAVCQFTRRGTRASVRSPIQR